MSAARHAHIIRWIAAGLGFAASHALAQAPPGGGKPIATLDTVEVSAQFRIQNMQETPISISAINAERMDIWGGGDVQQIAGIVPNLSIQKSSAGFGNAATMTLRGIGQYDNSFTKEPGVGEPPRESRRLQPLREWSHEQTDIEQIFP